MGEVLSLIERVKNSIALGESHFREFKTALEGKPDNKKPRRVNAICKEIGEALVAFTNADGGELLIGVEDDGEITGLSHSEEDIKTMLNAPYSHVMDGSELPLQKSMVIDIEDRQVLFFAVSKSTEKIFQLPDGRCVKRQDKSTMPVQIDKILFERKELLSRRYDQEFVDGASTTDLDLSLIQQVADGFVRGMSPEQYLQQIGIAEYGIGGLRLRRAALLLFAKDINQWQARSQVRILKVDGEQIQSGTKYNVISDESITGNILYLLSNSWEHLRPFLSQKTVLGAEAKFVQNYIYPENACREALTNAIAHRDYTISNPVTIYIFDNRLVFESPGELLSTISIAALMKGEGVHESRNSNIARVLRENKYMRELGEGIRRIIDLMESQELERPNIESQNGIFMISLSHKSIYTEREQSWLRVFEGYDLDVYQKRIVAAGIDGRELSPDVIFMALQSKDRNIYDRAITTLRVSGILQEIRTAVAAGRLAKQKGIPKQQIARFKVITPDKVGQSIETNPNKVYIYNLSMECDRKTVYQALSIFGKVVNVDLPLDSISNKCRGFAFVEFETEQMALKAIAIKSINIMNEIASIIPYKRSTRSKRRGK